jgi:hypothetical protein
MVSFLLMMVDRCTKVFKVAACATLIRLEITMLSAESYVMAARDYLGEEDLPTKTVSF